MEEELSDIVVTGTATVCWPEAKQQQNETEEKEQEHGDQPQG